MADVRGDRGRSMGAEAEPRGVGLLIESSRAYGRGLLRGIARYVRSHRGWSVTHQERSLADVPPDWLDSMRFDGIIARIETRQLLNRIRRLGIPAVDLRGRFDTPGVPLIDTDDAAVSRAAAEHLAHRGFRHFAFCGFAGVDYSNRRLVHFRAALAVSGFEVSAFEGKAHLQRAHTAAIEAGAMRYDKQLGTWLAGLPKPVGLMACNDICGQQVLRACRERGVRVPDEVAVVGVDNDDVLCDLSDPPLSSVAPATDLIGYEAARVLDEMMRGLPAPPATIYVEPVGVVTRVSTDVLAVPDPEVAAAVRFIRDRIGDRINVGDVVTHLAISRSQLERRFLRALGHTPKEEILSARIGRAKELLAGTDHGLATVAKLVGVPHAEHLCAMFRQRTGQTPGEFRKRAAGPRPVPQPESATGGTPPKIGRGPRQRPS